MNVGLIGEGPVAESIRSQLADTSIELASVSPKDAPDCAAIVVLADADETSIETVNEHVCGTDTVLVAIEADGFGGVPVDGLDVGAAILSGTGPCYRCLTTRVDAANGDASANDDAPPPASVRRVVGAIVGDALATAGTDAPAALPGRIWTWPYAERTVLAVPGCPCCNPDVGPTDRWLAPDDPTDPVNRSLEEALTRAERAVDDRVGIVTEVGEVASFPAPYYLAQLGATDGFSDGQAPTHAAGVAPDWNEAFMKALGEALERYSAGVYRSAWFVDGSAADVPGAVPIERFVRPDGWGDGPGASIPWIPATELAGQTDCMLPAETCVFPPPTREVRPAITTGLGLGSSGMAAIRAGLLEVIERDAMMLAWYSTFDPLGLRVDDDAFDRLASRARGEGLTVTPMLLTQDVDVPVIAVAVTREDDWPRFAVGSGADLDPAAAARSALCEAVQNWVELRDLGQDGAAQAGGWIGEYASFPAAARSFVDVTGTIDAGDIRSEPDGSPARAVDRVVEAVTAVGMTPYVAWLTPRDVRALGFEAVRVVLPTAQPLFTDTPYFGERLETVPGTLGFEPRPDRDPHPFP